MHLQCKIRAPLDTTMILVSVSVSAGLQAEHATQQAHLLNQKRSSTVEERAPIMGAAHSVAPTIAASEHLGAAGHHHTTTESTTNHRHHNQSPPTTVGAKTFGQANAHAASKHRARAASAAQSTAAHKLTAAEAGSKSASGGGKQSAIAAERNRDVDDDDDATNTSDARSKSADQRKPAIKHAAAPKTSNNKLEDPIFERRRKSIQDGDVFIYPTLYKDLNECQKCSRDNKICSCNPIETTMTATEVSSSSGSRKQQAITKSTQANCKTKCLLNGSNKRPSSASEQQQQQQKKPEVGCDEQRVIAASSDGGAHQVKRCQGEEEAIAGQDNSEEQIKTIYKISISTAAIDQKSKLFTPRLVIGPAQARSAEYPLAAAASAAANSSSPPVVPPRHADNSTNGEPSNSRQKGKSSGARVGFKLDTANTGKQHTCIDDSRRRDEALQLVANPITSTTTPAIATVPAAAASGAILNLSETTQAKIGGNLAELTSGYDGDDDDREQLLLSTADTKIRKHQEAGIEAKVTAISVGSSLRSLKPLNTCANLLQQQPSTLVATELAESTEPITTTVSKMADMNNNNHSTGPALHSQLCDNHQASINNKTSRSTIMNKLIEQERDGDEQLTCNLSVGDSIKIISTSIRIEGNKLVAHSNSSSSSSSSLMGRRSNDDSHTSIVPIVQATLSSRRRNLASKLSRQAICEDSAVESLAEDRKPLAKQFRIEEDEDETSAKAAAATTWDSASSSSGSNSDALEYSPILTSVRDYINNVNTELQVQGPQLLATECCDEFASGVGGSLKDAENATPSSPSFMHIAINGASPTATMINMADIVGATSTMVTSAIIGQTSTTMASNSGADSSGGGSSLVATTGGGGLLIHAQASTDSPKKSIFEGASKDEILEYLEDARERVPEILMAADDVMVINDNELIVVNQLVPGSPATPISIVEAAEMMSDASSLVDSSQLMADSQALSDPAAIERLTSPDQSYRHRLQQMYHSSQLTGASQFSSGNNTMDDDTGISSSGFNSKIDSSRNSMDTPETPSLIVATLESIEDRAPSRETSRSHDSDSGAASPQATITTGPITMGHQGQIMADAKEQNSLIGVQVNNTGDRQFNGAGSTIGGHESSPGEHATISSNQGGLMGGGSPLRTLNYGLAVRRRNSTSSDCANRAVSATSGGVGGATSSTCTIQMLRLQQRYSNRDSLSSPSTSPPSSTSPSSSTSSNNRTSGNCSAASTFYASSSISCSSPLLELATVVSSNNCSSTTTLALGNSSSQQQQRRQQAQASTAVGYSDPCELDPFGIGHTAIRLAATSPDTRAIDLNLLSQVERDDSGLGGEYSERNNATPPGATTKTLYCNLEPLASSSSFEPLKSNESSSQISSNTLQNPTKQAQILTASRSLSCNGGSQNVDNTSTLDQKLNQVSISDTSSVALANVPVPSIVSSTIQQTKPSCSSSMVRFNSAATNTVVVSTSSPTFSSSANLMSRSVHGHYATMNRLNNYFMNRHPLSENSDTTIEFQCLDCDQFIDVDHATMLHKSNEIRLLRATDRQETKSAAAGGPSGLASGGGCGETEKLLTTDQLDRAYIAAMNGLPLCNLCEKKRVERKEIISEFVETELKYGRDLKIIHDEFYRPMQIAGLLSKDHITGVFLNLDELIIAHCKFSIRLEAAIRDAHSMGDTDYNTVNIGRLFVESAEMLHAFESYCIRQGSAACLLARLAKEKELLRIFLRVSQMENTLLRRMNLAAFLMVPVQRVTKYPLLLNRLYKVTAYHHKDREVLRDAQLKVELHLEHINQQTKGVGATNKIWRRISNLSAPISNRRGLINAEDIGYIKLRKTAMDMLKWDRDETQFIHSGRLNFAPLNEFLIKQKMKPMRYMAAHALLIVLGKPNWKYRPDLVKSNLDSKLMTPTPGGNGVKEAALLLFREKGGRFIPCREPLFLSNCVLSADCSQYNSECPVIPANHHNQKVATTNSTTTTQTSSSSQAGNNCTNNMVQLLGGSNQRDRLGSGSDIRDPKDRSASTDSTPPLSDALMVRRERPEMGDYRANSNQSDTLSMASVKSLPDNHIAAAISPPTHTSRSYSLASALPRTTSSSSSLTKSSSITSSNLTIINHLMTKVNNYNHKQQLGATNGTFKATVTEQIKGQPMAAITTPLERTFIGGSSLSQQQPAIDPPTTTTTTTNNNNNNRLTTTTNQSNCPSRSSNGGNSAQNEMIHPQHYNHLFFSNHHHHQPYGDYEESFEIHERLTKESMLLRADTPLKTRYWLQMLRYHAKDLGQWRVKRNGLANIMMPNRSQE